MGWHGSLIGLLGVLWVGFDSSRVTAETKERVASRCV